jgi:hypothetical protein
VVFGIIFNQIERNKTVTVLTASEIVKSLTRPADPIAVEPDRGFRGRPTYPKTRLSVASGYVAIDRRSILVSFANYCIPVLRVPRSRTRLGDTVTPVSLSGVSTGGSGQTSQENRSAHAGAE